MFSWVCKRIFRCTIFNFNNKIILIVFITVPFTSFRNFFTAPSRKTYLFTEAVITSLEVDSARCTERFTCPSANHAPHCLTLMILQKLVLSMKRGLINFTSNVTVIQMIALLLDLMHVLRFVVLQKHFVFCLSYLLAV